MKWNWYHSLNFTYQLFLRTFLLGGSNFIDTNFLLVWYSTTLFYDQNLFPTLFFIPALKISSVREQIYLWKSFRWAYVCYFLVLTQLHYLLYKIAFVVISFLNALSSFHLSLLPLWKICLAISIGCVHSGLWDIRKIN